MALVRKDKNGRLFIRVGGHIFRPELSNKEEAGIRDVNNHGLSAGDKVKVTPIHATGLARIQSQHSVSVYWGLHGDSHSLEGKLIPAEKVWDPA